MAVLFRSGGMGRAAPRRLAAITLVLCAVLAPAAGYGAEPPPAAESPVGTRLTEEDVTYLLYGSTLYGIYVDGRPDWAEQTAVTGQLYDVTDDWAEVGTWNVIDGMACYYYWRSSGLFCFDVYEWQGQYYFYVAGSTRLVAITTRVERQPLM